MLLMISSLLSGVLALVRIKYVNFLFGAGPAQDAYRAAFKLPDLLSYFLTGGAVAISLITVLNRYLVNDDEEGADRALSVIMTTMLLVLCAGVLLAEFVAPYYVWFANKGFRHDPLRFGPLHLDDPHHSAGAALLLHRQLHERAPAGAKDLHLPGRRSARSTTAASSSARSSCIARWASTRLRLACLPASSLALCCSTPSARAHRPALPSRHRLQGPSVRRVVQADASSHDRRLAGHVRRLLPQLLRLPARGRHHPHRQRQGPLQRAVQRHRPCRRRCLASLLRRRSINRAARAISQPLSAAPSRGSSRWACSSPRG